jgi:hypothetical protein
MGCRFAIRKHRVNLPRLQRRLIAVVAKAKYEFARRHGYKISEKAFDLVLEAANAGCFVPVELCPPDSAIR